MHVAFGRVRRRIARLQKVFLLMKSNHIEMQSHSVFGFLSALSGIGTRGCPQESGFQTPPTRVIRDN